MSIVSGLIVCCCSSEGSANFRLINNWIADHWSGGEVLGGPMTRIEGWFGGNKHPQMYVAGAGLDKFGAHVEAFVAFVLSLTWEYRGNLIIVHQPEEGPTQVWRPDLSEYDDDANTVPRDL